MTYFTGNGLTALICSSRLAACVSPGFFVSTTIKPSGVTRTSVLAPAPVRRNRPGFSSRAAITVLSGAPPRPPPRPCGACASSPSDVRNTIATAIKLLLRLIMPPRECAPIIALTLPAPDYSFAAMKPRLSLMIPVLLIAVAALAQVRAPRPPANRPPAPKLEDGTPNLGSIVPNKGYWVPTQYRDYTAVLVGATEIPYQPWARALADEIGRASCRERV